MMTDEERQALIEECARHLDAVADKIGEYSDKLLDAGSDKAYENAIVSEMAYRLSANELRLLIPKNKEIDKQNHKKVEEYIRLIKERTNVKPPQLRDLKSTDH